MLQPSPVLPLAGEDRQYTAKQVDDLLVTTRKANRSLLRERSVDIQLPEPLEDLVSQMRAVMTLKKGVGLSAIQVGRPLRLIAMEMKERAADPERDLPYREKMPFTVMVNPYVMDISPEKVNSKETCLSLPDQPEVWVHRPEWIKIAYLNLQGVYQEVTLKGWHARVFAHEYDHLEGWLITDIEASPLAAKDNSDEGRLKELLSQLQSGQLPNVSIRDEDFRKRHVITSKK